MGHVFVFALAAALNPTLVAASTVMMLLPRPVRLMLGYLCGALMTSVTLGLVIVFSLEGSDFVSTSRRTLSPAFSIALGAISLVIAAVLGKPRGDHAGDRSPPGQNSKAPPRWQRTLSKGSPKAAFVIGALLTLPGASYLAGLSRIDKLNYSTPETVALVVGFNVVMLALLEIPLVSFVIAPDWTPAAVARAKAWVGRHVRRVGTVFFAAIGVLLIIRGLVDLGS